jgi:hypothetical protein
MLLALLLWPFRSGIQARSANASPKLTTIGDWSQHNFDLIYTMAFSSAQQQDGPLVAYRASGTDLRSAVAVAAVARSGLPQTPVFFPSPDGRYLALLNPLHMGYGSDVNGASLSILPTDGSKLTHISTASAFPGSLLLAQDVSSMDSVVWSADSSSLYYHTGAAGMELLQASGSSKRQQVTLSGYDEIHRVDLQGHDVTLLSQSEDGSSFRLLGLDRSGALLLTVAQPGKPVEIVRLNANAGMRASPRLTSVVLTLPPDILPGNALRVGSDGESVECERVTQWNPLRYDIVRIGFANRAVTHVAPLFDTARYGRALMPLARSNDGQVLVMSRVESLRGDLAAQGIPGVPAQESLVVANGRTGALQSLLLPPGGQLVQVFWAPHLASRQIHALPQNILAELMAFHKRQGQGLNASVFQQDEWMLEGHNGRLVDAPTLPQMCYGNCSSFNGAPHVSAAILHGVAYTESNWHQFNAPGYQVNGEAIGSPVESFDGGWGEFQQTWGMPPQCNGQHNCRGDAYRIQHDQSYNIGTGIQALINAWNNTAGVSSQSDPNDPFKANHWFFAVWAYNGAYGNNPNDVPSSQYGNWYPGAPFRSIYEEYVWYFAAHPQYYSNGWTDNYVPSLGPGLLPPQSDFANTSDSFVACATCTIPDWTAGSYDREWVGYGAPNATVASNFTSMYSQLGGENVLGLPRDNGGGAPVHRWGNGWTQDFGGGSDSPGALLLADGATTAYWVHGGVWTQYLFADHGATGCHGYPTSNLVPYTNSGLGSDSYYRQTFQTGFIVWDATTGMIAADVCS